MTKKHAKLPSMQRVNFPVWADSVQKGLGAQKSKQELGVTIVASLVEKSCQASQFIYCIYPKYSDTSTPYHICSKIWTSTIHYPMLCLKIDGWVANSVDQDETPRSAASNLGLYCLLRHICSNIYGKYGS